MCKYIYEGRKMKLGKVITGLFQITKGPKLIRCRVAKEVELGQRGVYLLHDFFRQQRRCRFLRLYISCIKVSYSLGEPTQRNSVAEFDHQCT